MEAGAQHGHSLRSGWRVTWFSMWLFKQQKQLVEHIVSEGNLGGEGFCAGFLWSPGDGTMGTVIKMLLLVPLDNEWSHQGLLTT